MILRIKRFGLLGTHRYPLYFRAKGKFSSPRWRSLEPVRGPCDHLKRSARHEDRKCFNFKRRRK